MDKIRVIKVFEDTPIKLNINTQERDDILSIRDIIGDNLSLQADGRLTISHYVGFIQRNKTRVLIYPKIARNVSNDILYNKSFDILVKMLSYTKFFEIKRINTPQKIERYEGDVLELLIGIFIDELLFLLKKDINRSYNPITENESFIKGKINFTENIKKNSYRKHLHYLKYEHFTENILMNQIFKSVVMNLIKKTTVNANKMKLAQALLWLEDVDLIKLTDDIWERVTFSRLNHQYKTVFNMAKLFYHNSSINLNKGDELSFSFLVPLNRLFERFVFELLQATINSDIYFKYQGPLSYLGHINGTMTFQLKPDISMMKRNQVLMIFDAKYKEVIDAEGNQRILQNDIYQMLAYSVKYHCNQIALIYPKMMGSGQENLELFSVEIPKENGILSIKVIQIDLESGISSTINKLSQYLGLFIQREAMLL